MNGHVLYWVAVGVPALAWFGVYRYLLSRVARLDEKFWARQGIPVDGKRVRLSGTPWTFYLFVLRRGYRALKDTRVTLAGDVLLLLTLVLILEILWSAGLIPVFRAELLGGG